MRPDFLTGIVRADADKTSSAFATRQMLFNTTTRIHDMRGKFNLFFKETFGALSGEETFIEKAYQEPYRGIVQADDALALQGAFTVIPGTHAAAF